MLKENTVTAFAGMLAWSIASSLIRNLLENIKFGYYGKDDSNLIYHLVVIFVLLIFGIFCLLRIEGDN